MAATHNASERAMWERSGVLLLGFGKQEIRASTSPKGKGEREKREREREWERERAQPFSSFSLSLFSAGEREKCPKFLYVWGDGGGIRERPRAARWIERASERAVAKNSTPKATTLLYTTLYPFFFLSTSHHIYDREREQQDQRNIIHFPPFLLFNFIIVDNFIYIADFDAVFVMICGLVSVLLSLGTAAVLTPVFCSPNNAPTLYGEPFQTPDAKARPEPNLSPL